MELMSDNMRDEVFVYWLGSREQVQLAVTPFFRYLDIRLQEAVKTLSPEEERKRLKLEILVGDDRGIASLLAGFEA